MLAAQYFPPELCDRVARYADGNFLVVTVLIQHYLATGRDRDAIVRLLDRLPAARPTPEVELFELSWQAALDRAPADLRDNVRLAAAALSHARAPVAAPLACGLLNLDTSTWETVRDALREFLTPVEVVAAGAGHPAYRLFHEAFAEFLRARLGSDAAAARDRWAEYCLESWDRGGPEGEYALRFAAVHGCDAIRRPASDPETAWNVARFNRLRGLLLDPDYLEARVGAGHVFALVADLDRAGWLGTESPGCSDRRLRLLACALGQWLHHIATRPEALLTCLWTYGWWYDHPSAEAHLEPPPGGWGDGPRPWGLEARLSERLNDWRSRRAAEHPPRYWVRSLRPPAIPLDPVSPLRLEGHSADVNFLAFHPDRTRMYTGSWDDLTFREWDSATGAPGEGMDGVSPYAVGFPGDGRVLIAGPADDGMSDVIVRAAWDPEPVFRHETELRFRGPFPTLSADGRRVAGEGHDCVVRVWDVDYGGPHCLDQNRAYREVGSPLSVRSCFLLLRGSSVF